MGRRNVSNVPAQSLVMLNDPFVIEQSKRWGDKIAKRSDFNEDQKITFMFESAIGRPPTPTQMEQIKKFLNRQEKLYGSKNHTDPRIWTDYGHMLFNMKEYIYLN